MTKFMTPLRLRLWYPVQPYRPGVAEMRQRDIVVAEMIQALYSVPQIKHMPNVTLGYFMRWLKTTAIRTGNRR